MIIKDLTNSKKEKRPIKLVSCLQISGLKFQESDYNYDLKRAKTVIRLAGPLESYNDYDLIMVDDAVFLGNWNDGFVEGV